MGQVFAAADIGSNTAHLLIGEVNGNSIRRLTNESVWLSLGEVVSRHGHIPPPQADILISTLRRFRAESQRFGATSLRVFATEAMRLASNQAAILTRVRDSVGIEVEIITAMREAKLSYYGTQLDSSGQEPMLLVEVGGGSAQIAWCEEGEISREFSLSVGTGRLIARYGIQQPCPTSKIGEMEAEIIDLLGGCAMRGHPKRLVASGGVARGLIRALHPDGDRTLQTYELDYAIRAASQLSVESIASRFSVKPKRAQSILPGATVYRTILRHFGFDSMLVSEFGVREGLIMEAAKSA